jgi:hypothetical protein
MKLKIKNELLDRLTLMQDELEKCFNLLPANDKNYKRLLSIFNRTKLELIGLKLVIRGK